VELTPVRVQVTDTQDVAALLLVPPAPAALLVLAHGAGAGMEHPFMAGLARALGERAIATFRYQFPYTEAGRRRPDAPAVLEGTVRAAVATASVAAPALPTFAGGKSMGGRMTSRAASSTPGLDARGIVFFGFPLHAAGRAPSPERAAHLAVVPQPLLFLQGTRDALAELGAIRAVCAALPRATLHVVDDADHGFHVPKRTGRDDAAALEELADVSASWMKAVAARSTR
jgi:predicted alpha/beta-hydrolase family hydrolase